MYYIMDLYMWILLLFKKYLIGIYFIGIAQSTTNTKI